MSICIDCKKGADECEWLFRLRPVPGWKARKVRCGNFVTFDVKECPHYEKNRAHRRIRRTKKELAAAQRLMYHELATLEVAQSGS
jgi:hypothetical protein